MARKTKNYENRNKKEITVQKYFDVLLESCRDISDCDLIFKKPQMGTKKATRKFLSSNYQIMIASAFGCQYSLWDQKLCRNTNCRLLRLMHLNILIHHFKFHKLSLIWNFVSSSIYTHWQQLDSTSFFQCFWSFYLRCQYHVQYYLQVSFFLKLILSLLLKPWYFYLYSKIIVIFLSYSSM